MKILVDADACPVKEIIIKVAKEFQIPVFMFVDTSHLLKDNHGTIITVDKANDSVDFALLNQTQKGDIAVTQDYGLAAMLLAKKAYVIHQNGFLYTDEQIDRMLFERFLSKELRRQKKRTTHFKKRTIQNNETFETCFRQLCQKLCYS